MLQKGTQPYISNSSLSLRAHAFEQRQLAGTPKRGSVFRRLNRHGGKDNPPRSPSVLGPAIMAIPVTKEGYKPDT